MDENLNVDWCLMYNWIEKRKERKGWLVDACAKNGITGDKWWRKGEPANKNK